MAAPDQLVIRAGLPTDAGALAGFGEATFRSTYAADPATQALGGFVDRVFGDEQQAAELADPACHFLVAELDDHLRRLPLAPRHDDAAQHARQPAAADRSVLRGPGRPRSGHRPSAPAPRRRGGGRTRQLAFTVVAGIVAAGLLRLLLSS